MSDILYNQLLEKYPDTPRGYKRVSLYPKEKNAPIEFFHLNLVEKIFTDIEDRKPLANKEEIKDIADKIFDDVTHKFWENTEEGYMIKFSLEGIDDYFQHYSGHYIAVDEHFFIPKIVISTGNRGLNVLHPKQRERYFKFVNEVYDLFVERAKERVIK